MSFATVRSALHLSSSFSGISIPLGIGAPMPKGTENPEKEELRCYVKDRDLEIEKGQGGLP